MKDRIKKIRKDFDLTQSEFGERLGVKGNTITNYENGLRNPSDAIIFSICREFNVDEKWLRTGEGKDPYIPRTRNQVITDFAADLILEPDSFKTRLIEGMSKLDVSDWEEIERIVLKITENKNG